MTTLAATRLSSLAAIALVAVAAGDRRGVLPSSAAARGAGFRRLVANASGAPYPYPDQEPAQCTAGQNCTNGGMPVMRGLCVVSTNPGAGQACWDVCNLAHPPTAYKVTDSPTVTKSYAGMVELVRAGLNPAVRCPNVENSGDPCPPGELCPDAMLQFAQLQKGRGMCVIDSTSPNSRACRDMCNYRRGITDFTFGTPEGTGQRVSEARGSGICPGTPWWFYPVVGASVLGVLGCVVVGVYLVRIVGARRKKLTQQRDADPQQDFGDRLVDNPQHVGEELVEPMPQQGYPQEPPEPPRQKVIQELPVGFYGGAPCDEYQVGLSSRSMQLKSAGELQPPPYAGPGGWAPDPLGLTGGSMKIPGLDPPNLLSSITGSAQRAPGPGIFQPQQQYSIGTPRAPQVITSFSAQPQQVAQPSFHTRVPSNFAAGGASPPASFQARPTGVAPAGGFFTTIQRR